MFCFDVDDGWTTLSIGITSDGKIFAGYIDHVYDPDWEKSNWLELLIVTGVTAEEVLEMKQHSIPGNKVQEFLDERRKSNEESV